MFKVLLLSILLLTSCIKYENKFEKTLDTFVGKGYQSIVDHWGHPTDSYAGPNGNDVIHYLREKDITSSSPDRYDTEGEPIEDYCDVYFELDKDQNILNYTYRGTYCWEE